MLTSEVKKIFEDYITQKGLKYSEKRMQVLDVILRSGRHLTVEQLYEKIKRRFSGIGQATVYRTLKLLNECGICRAIRSEDGVIRHELLHGHKHHDHLICIKCGIFVEAVDPEIERLQERLAKRKGFKVVRHKLELYGLCPGCRKEKKEK